MKEKIDQMNKVIQYGDEQVVMNMATRQIVGHIVDYGDERLVMKGAKVVGHVVTVEEKKSIVTVVAQKIVRMFTA